jgi:class 3 adenylate cyclase
MLDFERLSLTEIIRLQNQLSAVLAKRFERFQALAFSDIVESTAYFARFGDEAGRRLQQYHIDLLERVLADAEGRIVDTAGDGVFMCFPSVATAVHVATAFQRLRAEADPLLTPGHHLAIRMAIHWGPVLTDGVIVTGDSVNLCARLTRAARPQAIVLSKAAFLELSNVDRLRCHVLASMTLAGVPDPVDLIDYEWRDTVRFPTRVRIEETGEELPLPDQSTITFGRLRYMDGVPANDIVLSLPDPDQTQQISRWHFELRREPGGFVLRSASARPTLVNGVPAVKGQAHPISVGASVTLSGVITLRFLSSQPSLTDDTITVQLPVA